MSKHNDKADKKNPMLRSKDFINDADEETTAEAFKAKEEGLLMLAVLAAKIPQAIYTRIHHQLPTTMEGFDTMAVTIAGDGRRFLLYNPKFVLSLRQKPSNDVAFILFHEAMHLLLNHLNTDPDLRGDQTFTIAQEAIINAHVLARLKRVHMPQTLKGTDENGNDIWEPTGVDPRELHKQYKADLDKQKLDSVDYDTFVSNENDCYIELKRMTNPPGKQQNVCVHAGDAPDGSAGENSIQMDQDTLDQIMSEAISDVVTNARQGDEQAREEVLATANLSGEENQRATKLWGKAGLGALRGETDATRKVPWWQTWLKDQLASRLQAGYKMIWPKKRAGILTALGMSTTLARRGHERKVRVAIFFDTSGSMPQSAMDFVAKLVGEIPDAITDFYMFDGVVERLVPGETVRGGGGTDFQNCVDVAEGRTEVDGELIDEDYDVHIMLTDGYAAPVTPADPEKWIWLITRGGDTWPERHNPIMDCHEIDTDDEV